MFARFVQEVVETVIFLGMLFGLLYFLLIAADPAPLLDSAKYYFWHVLPLSVLGVLFAAVEAFRNVYWKKAR